MMLIVAGWFFAQFYHASELCAVAAVDGVASLDAYAAVLVAGGGVLFHHAVRVTSSLFSSRLIAVAYLLPGSSRCMRLMVARTLFVLVSGNTSMSPHSMRLKAGFISLFSSIISGHFLAVKQLIN